MGFSFKIGHSDSLYNSSGHGLTLFFANFEAEVGHCALRFDHVYSSSVVVRLSSYSFPWYWSTRLSSQSLVLSITYLISELAVSQRWQVQLYEGLDVSTLRLQLEVLPVRVIIYHEFARLLFLYFVIALACSKLLKMSVFN